MKQPLLCIALWLVGCLGTKDNALFTPGAAATGGSASSGDGGSVAAEPGTGSRNQLSGAAGSLTAAGAAGATPSGGTGPGPGGRPGTASGGTAAGSSGGSEQQGLPLIERCDMLEQAMVDESSGHCYRVNFQNLTFEAASEACHAAGGHLVTVSNEAENDFVRDLHDGEHWLGATDGRADTTPGAGTYFWVTGEAWSFAAWEDDQPNAYETDCPDQDDTADCFEHCAFQTDEGDWNDRSCWHTVVSVCEWDLAPLEGGAGGAGAGGAGP